jgi:hypothetical protein
MTVMDHELKEKYKKAVEEVVTLNFVLGLVLKDYALHTGPAPKVQLQDLENRLIDVLNESEAVYDEAVSTVRDQIQGVMDEL